MKNLLCAFFVVGMVSSCGLGNSSAGSSANGLSSASSAGSGSSANIFGRRNRVERQNVDAVNAVSADGRTLVALVKTAKIERTRDGGIVHARAVMPRQGYYDAKLVSADAFKPDENGVLVLEFRAKEPQFNTVQSTERSREVDVGVFLSNQTLANIRSIRIVSRQNQVTLRR